MFRRRERVRLVNGRILLTDDEPEIHGLLAPLLQREGLIVVCANRKQEAISLVGRQN